MEISVLISEDWKIIKIDYTRTFLYLTGLNTHKRETSMSASMIRTPLYADLPSTWGSLEGGRTFSRLFHGRGP